MSTSSQFLGSGTKSLQSGDAAAGNVTIAAVDPNKALVTNLGNSNGPAKVRLVNATTVAITATGGSTAWQVEEKY